MSQLLDCGGGEQKEGKRHVLQQKATRSHGLALFEPLSTAAPFTGAMRGYLCSNYMTKSIYT